MQSIDTVVQSIDTVFGGKRLIKEFAQPNALIY